MIPNNIHYVQYNGIQLNLSAIESFESETVYDPDEVDRIYNKIRIRCSGIANGVVNQGGLSNAAFIAALRTALQEPRKPLIIAFNGTPTVNIPGADANNGPNPLWVRVYQFSGDTIYVDFEIEAWEAACTNSAVVVTSNRWAQTVDIDQDGYSTLTSAGILTINGNRTPYNADYFRSIPQPVLVKPDGFDRVSQDFTVSSDGNELAWRVVDREVLFPAMEIPDNGGTPRLITRWQGEWQEGVAIDWQSLTDFANVGALRTLASGTYKTGTFTVTAWGQKTTPKNILVQFCIGVFNSRRSDFLPGAAGIIASYDLSEQLNENAVTLTATVIGSSLTNILGQSIQASKVFGRSINDYIENSTFSQGIADRGTAGLWLVIKDIVGTCDSKTTNTVKTSNPAANDRPSTSGTVPTSGAKTLGEAANDVLQDGKPYLATAIETKAVTNQGVIQLPRASGDPATASFLAQMNSPVSKKIVRFALSRLNQAPQLPQPIISGCTLLSSDFVMSEPVVLASGVDRIYAVRGQYVFAVNDPLIAGQSTLQMPHQITDRIPLSDNPQTKIVSSNFIAGLIG